MKGILGLLLNITWLLLAGCGAAEDCMKGKGKSTERNVELSNYHALVLTHGVNVRITPSKQPGAIVRGGANLLPKIHFRNENGVLRIEDGNKCNWVRDNTKPVEVELALSDLGIIENYGFGDINSTGTLAIPDLFILHKGEGKFSLDIDCEKLEALNVETGDMIVSGRAKNTVLVQVSYGLSDFCGLNSDSIYVENRGVNTPCVNASKILRAVFANKGDIVYTSEPDTIVVDRYAFASGQLKKKTH